METQASFIICLRAHKHKHTKITSFSFKKASLLILIATVARRRVKCFRLSQHGYHGPITADRDSSANKLAVDFIAGETALPY